VLFTLFAALLLGAVLTPLVGYSFPANALTLKEALATAYATNPQMDTLSAPAYITVTDANA